jgi:hypothetical protein
VKRYTMTRTQRKAGYREAVRLTRQQTRQSEWAAWSRQCDEGWYYPGDDYFSDDDEYDREHEELDDALEECGQSASYPGCTLAGTEHCDFECPFRDMDLSEDVD